MAYTDILKIVPTIQSAALAKHTLKLATKKKAKTKDFVETGVGTMVGAALIKEEADFIGGFK